MKSKIARIDGEFDFIPLSVIRVETALSRYPVHRLAKKGDISIDLHEENEQGMVTMKWEVTFNQTYGQPGPLAYKVDTLIVNRRIEEENRPVPRVIRLGSLRDLCRELGVNEGQATQSVKNALFQNAFTSIRAKIRYRHADGTEKSVNAGFNRYSVVFTGEQLPDGRNADAVYLVLNDVYMQVINGAVTRPLDYDYLKELPPSSQRFYELVSYQMYAALKSGRHTAKLVYSEYSTYAPQTRYYDFDHVKKQMYKIHALHRKSRYIEAVEYEATCDREGKPDWVILYKPGPKARAEYRAFTKKGGQTVLEIESLVGGNAPALPPISVCSTPLERALVDQGISAMVASKLASEHPEDQIRAQLEMLAWRMEKKSRKPPTDPAAFLVDAIRKNYPPPGGFESQAKREAREAGKRETEKRAREDAQRAHDAKARADDRKARVDAYVTALSPGALTQLEQEALAQAPGDRRAAFERERLPSLKRAFLRGIRDQHVRRILGLLDPDELGETTPQ